MIPVPRNEKDVLAELATARINIILELLRAIITEDEKVAVALTDAENALQKAKSLLRGSF